MEKLARLPVFLGLAGKRAIVVGGTAAAAWKAELLSAAGASVDVYAADAGDELVAIAADAPGGTITIHARAPTPADAAGATMAIGAVDDDRAAQQFAAAMRAAGVAVNVIDKPEFSDFTFGAIVNRSPLVIGVSTDGAAPVFSQAIRARLERLIPRGFAGWAEAARGWRPLVAALGLPFRGRLRFWERFTDRAMTHPDRTPGEADLAALMAGLDSDEKPMTAGAVALVAAGPGDPELLTLRAVRALQSADVILIDDRVAPEILDFARREAKRMMVRATGPGTRRDEITAMLIMFAKAGRRVVRLDHDGAERAEAMAACRAAGLSVEVVPGVTAAPALRRDDGCDQAAADRTMRAVD